MRLPATQAQHGKTRGRFELVDALNGWLLNSLIDQVGESEGVSRWDTNEGPLFYLSLALVNIRRINATQA
jgi:hypothetical protein